MERSLSSLTYKGSIAEAITESKRQKKLFVVYISGENAESARLEASTWTHSTVSESVSKYCILLHVREGSSDAANFTALYPQSSVPCITAIGFNGLQLWKNEGFVSAEVLASSIEKAWLSLHIQETTAGILTAALASKKSEPSSSIVPNAASPAGGSSDATIPSPSVETGLRSSEGPPLVTSGRSKENDTGKHTENASDNKISSSLTIANSTSFTKTSKAFENSIDEGSSSCAKSDKATVSPIIETNLSAAASDSNVHHHPSFASEKKADHHSCVTEETKMDASKANEEAQYVTPKGVDEMKVDRIDDSPSINQSTDVHLNIRLPDGSTLKEKFPMTGTLQIVKDYVDRNQADVLGPYNLAIPYPRKVFSGQELTKSLSELSLLNRQALIVVPLQRATTHYRRGSSSQPTNFAAETDSADGAEGGYFAFVRKMIAYMNPFSYFGGSTGSSSSGQQSQTGMWEYGPNPALRNNISQTERPHTPYSPSRNASTGTNNIRSRTSRFGSNIHTLRHDEDDARSSDRNAFWNGNSTQYGGDNNGR